MQILKVQIKTERLTVFLVLLGSVPVKAGCKMLMKFTPDEGPFKYYESLLGHFFDDL
jgi:hypothetical protein